jgi:protein involved in polysaccharide export with SLBB domain/uncharacterized protein involved in exopolysaccharide biosynthesis
MSPADDFSIRALNDKRDLVSSPATTKSPSSSVIVEAIPATARNAPQKVSPLAKLPFDPFRVIGALWRSGRRILFITTLFAAFGFGLGLMRFKNLFVASTTLIRQETPNTFQARETGEAFKPNQLTASTLVSVMHSPALLKHVAQQFDPPLSPVILGLKLTVTPERNTDVITIAYEGWESREATESVLNTYAKEVIRMTRDFQAQEAVQVNRVLKEQLSTIDVELAKAGQSVLDYSKEAGIVSADKETDAYLRQVGDLSLKYESTRIEFETFDLKIDSLEAELARHNPVAAKLQQARDDLNNLLIRYTDANPAVIEQKSRVAEVEKEMANSKPTGDDAQLAGGTAATSLYLEIVDLKAQKETLAKQLSQLAKVRDAVQEKLSALPEKNVQLAQLQARRESLESARALLASRQREAQIFEDNPPGYYRVLSPASAQDVATKKRWPKVACATIGLGLLAAFVSIAIVALREILDDRIASVHDLARATKLPVLLEVPPLNGPALQTWSLRAWTSLAPRLEPTAGGAFLLGVVAGQGGDDCTAVIGLLASAAAQRGYTVVTVSRGAKAGEKPALSLAKFLEEPRTILSAGTNESGVHEVIIDADWKWSREHRLLLSQALSVWPNQRSLVALVELQFNDTPETLLVAESLPNVIWLGGESEHSDAVRQQVESLRSVRCQLAGAIFCQHEPATGPSWLAKLSGTLLALVLLGSTLSAAEPVVASSQASLSVQTPSKLAPWQERLTLGAGDTINVTLFGHPETARTELPIGPDGKINFLEAQDISAAGLTIDELRDALDKELSKYYRNARTMISPAILRSKQYFILGKVVDKGAFTLDRPLTIVEAIARARGLETGLFEQNTVELADLPRSFLVRHGERMKVDFERLFQKGDLSQNVQLEPNDYLYFPSSNTNEVYVLGSVQSPGIQGFTPDATVVSMVTTRGGFMPKAYVDHVLVVRGSLTHPQTFVVNVGKILKGRAPDFRLEPKDIVFISDKPWARAEELLDIAVRTFVQAAAAGWAGQNIGPIITSPIFPSIK